MTNCWSFDGEKLAPYVCDDIAKTWNEFKPDKWRTWQHSKSNSKSKSAHRLTIILRNNAQWLDCSRQSDIDDLYEQFRTYLILALAHVKDKGQDQVNDLLGTQYEITCTFWTFIRDLKNVHTLAQLRLGKEPDQALKSDQDRRKRKSEILREFGDCWKEYAREAAYLSGSGEYSNRQLEQALEAARTAMQQALEDLKWSAD